MTLAAFITTTAVSYGQAYKPGQIISVQATLPVSCTPPDLLLRTTGTITLYVCSAADTWSPISTSPFPSNAIMLIDSGTCPTGFVEVSGLNGKTVLGTVAANGDVGATGGSDTITPTGAIAWPAGVPTFTGSSANTTAVTAGTPAGTNSTSATTGNCAASNVAIGTGAANACKATAPNLTVSAQTFTGSALATHQHAVTATGTIAWPAGVPTFTGAQFDNRSAFVKWIACKKS